MPNQIHPTAIIGDRVVLGENNVIGAYAVIDGNIHIGNNNTIGSGSFISNNVVIGNDNNLVGHVSIGSLGEMGTKGDIFLPEGKVIIGDHNVFREFLTVNSPVRKPTTSIGNNGYFMARTHIPHDAQVGNSVVMATNSLIGGGCVVEDYAYIGLNSTVHQWVDIGEFAMIGLQAGVTRHVPPFCIVTGTPARLFKINRVGAERRGFFNDEIKEAEENLRAIILEGYTSENRIISSIRRFMEGKSELMKSFV